MSRLSDCLAAISNPTGRIGAGEGFASDEAPKTRALVSPFAGTVAGTPCDPRPEPLMETNGNRPCVSVIMLTCDRPKFIDRAIASVLAQQFDSWELIVVHDGDNESSWPTLQRWMAVEPRIRYFRRLEKRNIANAYNFALSQARGEYVAILDDDDYWVSPLKLTQQVSFLDARLEYVSCGGGMIIVDSDGRELMRCHKLETDAEIRRWALVANPMVHSTMMFRRMVGGQPVSYDETLEGFQDWDLWLRLTQMGRVYNFPTLFTGYTLWRGNSSFFAQRANARSAVAILKRHRAAYRGVSAAIGIVSLQYIYAFLPVAIRRYTFVPLSKMKKRIFGRQVAPQVAPGMPAHAQFEKSTTYPAVTPNT